MTKLAVLKHLGLVTWLAFPPKKEVDNAYDEVKNSGGSFAAKLKKIEQEMTNNETIRNDR